MTSPLETIAIARQFGRPGKREDLVIEVFTFGLALSSRLGVSVLLLAGFCVFGVLVALSGGCPGRVGGGS
ncbi:MAG TPA: hypothetical protein VED41_08555, partial [Solirubrobacteraceae bacterium]|nr:hypothetical protein [Solirubrobacteraceae bacterium]